MNERFKLWGCVLALIIRDNKILMILRKNKPDAGNFNLVGGRMEENETVAMAITREIKEEIGLDVTKADIDVVGSIHRVCPSGWNSIEYVVTVKNLQGEPVNNEPYVCERLEWLPLDNLPENITPYARCVVENFIKGVTFSEVNS